MQEPTERRPFRFGLVLEPGEGRRDRVVETARRAEAAGITEYLVDGQPLNDEGLSSGTSQP